MKACEDLGFLGISHLIQVSEILRVLSPSEPLYCFPILSTKTWAPALRQASGDADFGFIGFRAWVLEFGSVGG